MYPLLCRFLPRPAAAWVLVLLYAALLLLCLLAALMAPQADFRYGEI